MIVFVLQSSANTFVLWRFFFSSVSPSADIIQRSMNIAVLVHVYRRVLAPSYYQNPFQIIKYHIQLSQAYNMCQMLSCRQLIISMCNRINSERLCQSIMANKIKSYAQ